MGRKRFNPYVIPAVEIVDISHKGLAIGRHENQVIFISGAVPGDIVDVWVYRKKKNYLEGKVEKIVKKSPDRTDAFCDYFGACGGCKWQYLSYKAQLKFKEKQVHDSYSKIAGIPKTEILPIIESSKTENYRNKMEYSFSSKRWLTKEEIASGVESSGGLGLHVPGVFDKVIDLEKCYLQGIPSNEIRNAIRDYATKNSLSYYDIKNHVGLLRNLIIRTSTTQQVMVVVVFGENKADEISLLMKFLKEEFPVITSLNYVVNTKFNDTISDLPVVNYSGEKHIIEILGELSFIVSPKSFFQTNSLQAEVLYDLVKEFAGLSGKEIVYDLYTGTGSIANYIAKDAKKVIGVEYIPDAIKDAEQNSVINAIGNTVFFVGDMKDVFNKEFINENGKPNLVILDPPRAGMHPDVVKTLLKSGVERIVYVSCNPSTQARDIETLLESYNLVKSRPVDMFPHTQHVENIALLELK